MAGILVKEMVDNDILPLSYPPDPAGDPEAYLSALIRAFEADAPEGADQAQAALGTFASDSGQEGEPPVLRAGQRKKGRFLSC